MRFIKDLLKRIISQGVRHRLWFCWHYWQWFTREAKSNLAKCLQIKRIARHCQQVFGADSMALMLSKKQLLVAYRPKKIPSAALSNMRSIGQLAKPSKIYGQPGFWYTRLKKHSWFSRCFVADLNDVYVSDKGRVFNESGQALIEAWHRRDFRFKHRLNNRLFGVQVATSVPDSIKEYDKVLVLAQSSSAVYGHFLVDILPRLQMVMEEVKKGTPIYVNLDFNVYRQALDLLGVPDEQIINANEQPLIKVSNAIVPCYRQIPNYESLDFAGQIFAQLRQSALEKSSFSLGEKLYVARSDKSSRNMTNQKEVELFLNSQGFKKVLPETLSLADQVSLFATAKIVIGMHGSALFNCVFCDSSATVIDLFPACVNANLYSVLAPFGINYIPVQSPEGSMVNWSMNQSFKVDVGDLKNVVLVL